MKLHFWKMKRFRLITPVEIDISKLSIKSPTAYDYIVQKRIVNGKMKFNHLSTECLNVRNFAQLRHAKK